MSPRGPPERHEAETVGGATQSVANLSVTGELQQIDEAEYAPANAHQCQYCNNWYARPDHLKRHMRSREDSTIPNAIWCLSLEALTKGDR